ncbi:MAG: hypothetical protein RRA92_06380 [Gemmatimonadota bacterium]|nr:hypothetical protein [Gemmatimonadota bacterium]
MSEIPGPVPDALDSPAGDARVLLVTAHDWFASSLQAVLEPENFVVERTRTARDAVRTLPVLRPALVVIDEELVDIRPEDLIASLRGAGLPPSVPVVVYSPSFWRDGTQTGVMQAGAWDVLREPIRPHLLVGKFRRLLQIKDLIERVEEGSLSDAATGLLNIAGLVRLLRVLGSAAERSGTSLSCAVVSLQASGEPAADLATRRHVAALVQGNVRRSDVCGWLSEHELGVLAFGANPTGTTVLVRRLEEAARASACVDALAPIRAGVAQLSGRPEEPHGERIDDAAGEATGLSRLASARQALRSAELAGGGIRLADLAS